MENGNVLKISLKAARVNAGLTQKKAAERLGISESTLIKWEKTPRKVDWDNMENIENLYGISWDNIFLPSKSD